MQTHEPAHRVTLNGKLSGATIKTDADGSPVLELKIACGLVEGEEVAALINIWHQKGSAIVADLRPRYDQQELALAAGGER